MNIFNMLVICVKFQTECLKTLRGVDKTISLPLTETLTLNCPSQKCRNIVKNYYIACKKSHAYLQYACAEFQTECLKTQTGVDYTNHIEA